MMELLLARFNASVKEHMQQKKADKKSDWEDLKGMMEEMNANQVEMRSAVQIVDVVNYHECDWSVTVVSALPFSLLPLYHSGLILSL
jgi:hypothetical protein